MKSPIRQVIEDILGMEFPLVFIDATSKKHTKYRMKLCSSANHMTLQQKEKIEKLPHVIKVGYFSSGHFYAGYSGYVIYFDCKPSTIEIELPEKLYEVTITEKMSVTISVWATDIKGAKEQALEDAYNCNISWEGEFDYEIENVKEV